MEASNEILWLVAGVILVILEFTAIPGVGMLFAGVAALLVGILVETMGIDLNYQWIIFLAGTAILSLIFYKPLKNFRSGKAGNYNDMLGQTAVTITALVPGKEGKVKWSGTTMKARLHSGATAGIDENKEVTITSVAGNVLIVKE